MLRRKKRHIRDNRKCRNNHAPDNNYPQGYGRANSMGKIGQFDIKQPASLVAKTSQTGMLQRIIQWSGHNRQHHTIKNNRLNLFYNLPLTKDGHLELNLDYIYKSSNEDQAVKASNKDKANKFHIQYDGNYNVYLCISKLQLPHRGECKLLPEDEFIQARLKMRFADNTRHCAPALALPSVFRTRHYS